MFLFSSDRTNQLTQSWRRRWTARRKPRKARRTRGRASRPSTTYCRTSARRADTNGSSSSSYCPSPSSTPSSTSPSSSSLWYRRNTGAGCPSSTTPTSRTSRSELYESENNLHFSKFICLLITRIVRRSFVKRTCFAITCVENFYGCRCWFTSAASIGFYKLTTSIWNSYNYDPRLKILT